MAAYSAEAIVLHRVSLGETDRIVTLLTLGRGKLHAVARPVTRGRSSQVWEVWIRDAEEQLVAQGRVRLLCVAEDKALG